MFGFSEQVRDVLFARFGETVDGLQVLLKIFAELSLLLIPPCRSECVELVGNRIRAFTKFGIEFLERTGKLP